MNKEQLFGQRTFVVCALLIVAGAISFIVGLSLGAGQRVWGAFLVNLLFWLGIAQGGVVVSASLYVTHARWGRAGVYRLAEGFAGFLPVGFILFWALFLGRTFIFPWIRDPIPQKAAWLNTSFMFQRDGYGLLLITLLSLWFIHASRKKETVLWAESADIDVPPKAVRRLAPALMMVYAVVYSVLAFDLVMSLSPVWYSTLFGAYFAVGAYWSALAAMGLMASVGFKPFPEPDTAPLRSLHDIGKFGDPMRSLHDIGKLVFAFSIFWAYLLWSQYLPIWYAAIPEETFFVVQRIHRLPWALLSWPVLFLVWFTPFVVLIGLRGKCTPAIIGTVCGAGLVGMWLERYVLVVPSLSPATVPFGLLEILITAGFGAGFVLCMLPGLQRLRVAVSGGGQ